MFRTSTDFYNYFMSTTSFAIGIIQGLVFAANYPNEFLNLPNLALLKLDNPERFSPELTLGFGGFFIIIGIVYLVLRREGNNPVDADDRKVIPKVFILQLGLMIYANYFPTATFGLIGIATLFGLLAKPESGK